MAISDIWRTVAELGGAAFIIVLFALIKVKPLEISIWSWIARKLGRALNGETNDRLDALEKTLITHLKEEEVDKILQIRMHILRFADEEYENVRHSKDHYEEILDQIVKYNNYCAEHPEFENGKTEPSAEIIKRKYEEKLLSHAF